MYPSFVVLNIYRRWCLVLFLALALSPTAWGAIDAYALQGEYLGNYETFSEGQRTWAAQVVALDRIGKFRIAFAKGGLPGSGWDKTTQKDGFANAIGDKVTFTVAGVSLTVQGNGDSLVISDNLGGNGVLKKVKRVSPTLNRIAPSGALILFDGTGTKAWKDGQFSVDNNLKSGPTTVKTFQDFLLHLEFKTPFTPNDTVYPNRGNSGVYLQGRYELQVYDNFGWQAPYDSAFYRTFSIEPEGGCGSIYEISAPKINAAFPPGSWQTYDISFKAARFDGAGKLTTSGEATIYQNGILIQDKVSITKASAGAPLAFGPEPGPIFLQFHVSEVVYRNIWIEENSNTPVTIDMPGRGEIRTGSKVFWFGKGDMTLRADGRLLKNALPIPGVLP